jgi:hypothetical protein
VTPPGRGTWASRPRVFKFLNPFMHLMLRLPIERMRELLPTFTGRPCDRRFTLPLSHVEDGDASLPMPGGGAWKLNLQDGRPVEVGLRGQERTEEPDLITYLDEIERLPVLFRGNRQAEACVGVPLTPDGKLDRAQFEWAVADGFVIVRFHVASGGGS